MQDEQSAREFRARWQAVAEVEFEELRTDPVELRWRQLDALFRLARGLGLSLEKPEEEVEAVRARWNRLKDLLA